ncbi:YggT family protein [Tissierella creatinophila]|uniref:YGGT family protein n=1 Tax=Tissierella creatinophila DSM 6911 TaxID=1123403 RepID=A0A1U7M2Z4_TISCR|nr:YggT family protein [Tissierella creatinophila]OLS01693.1 YGGT family protein [Tissierella creatinophila DSM 6911]
MIVFYKALEILIKLIEFLIVIRILLSFINLRVNSSIGEFIFNLTEPILSPARNLIAKLNINTGFFDFSPLLAILLLRLFYSIVGRILFS